MMSRRVVLNRVNQQVFYSVKNLRIVQVYSGMMVPGGEDLQGIELEVKQGRASQQCLTMSHLAIWVICGKFSFKTLVRFQEVFVCLLLFLELVLSNKIMSVNWFLKTWIGFRTEIFAIDILFPFYLYVNKEVSFFVLI